MAVRTYQGKTPVVGDKVFIDEAAVVLGDVEIGSDSSIWPCAVIRGDMHEISIGERTSVQDGSVLHITHAGPFNTDGWPLHIGSDVTIGHNATLHGCTIHDRVLIGIGAIVMDGAVVESEVLVAAGAMVPPRARLESGYVYKGNPAKKARPLTDKEREFFLYSSKNYVNLKNTFLAESTSE
ncbi:gamma carbonic anhydrase family protein [Parendozoicomonas haliclonae]|uniref:UDP-3-O-[3-hydroxymyristoyl] glucosamine N-acyltransferase n=1 Tax=Parendozoicomonas haliclonae TaxID=1960125 RepID=A0A1X7AJR3_9GAMM|nr:gamma carbonic anhydrase family protein [Parendozoicomonas haliclonae]SMA46293.1 UDP-3-O-[3-hydroxymyristoyl] glucosamine N-acyltransferase [Parendozoicomonas haliclonae]